MKEFGKFCLIIILTIISTIFSGYVFLQLYNWFFLVPFNAPILTLAQAIGLKLCVGYMQTFREPAVDTDASLKTDIRKFLIYNFAVLITWGIAFIITLFL